MKQSRWGWLFGSIGLLAVVLGWQHRFWGIGKVAKAYWLIEFGGKKTNVSVFPSETMGFLAGAGKDSVYLWAGGWLRRLEVAPEAKFLAMRGCAGEPPQDMDVNKKTYADLSEWKRNVRPGSLVVFHKETGKMIDTLTAIDFWLFINAPINEQCKLAQ